MAHKEDQLRAIHESKYKLSQFLSVPVHIAVVGIPGCGRATFCHLLVGEEIDEDGSEKNSPSFVKGDLEGDHNNIHPESSVYNGYIEFKLWNPEQIPSESYEGGTTPDLMIMLTGCGGDGTIQKAWSDGHLSWAKSFSVPTFWVRSQFDLLVKEEGLSDPVAVEALQEVVRLRLAAEAKVDHVYVVSSKFEELIMYDTGLLALAMASSLNGAKRQTLASKLYGGFERLLDFRRAALINEIPYLAGLASAGCFVPVPGPTMLSDTLIIVSFIRRCYIMFGFDNRILEKMQSEDLPESLKIAVKKARAYFATGASIWVAHHLLTSSPASHTVLRSILSFSVPVLGQAVSGVVGFSDLQKFCECVVEEAYTFSVDISKLHLNRVRQSTSTTMKK